MALSKRGAIIIISLVLFESVCLGERDLSCLEEGLFALSRRILEGSTGCFNWLKPLPVRVGLKP
ncbi:hypothetical protein SynROS8604_03054 [Synechococcus sp. ROS8604]|nr:hypothetical protein SynROS8604_03054 [Synechococcus sp. ROS8604]